VSSATDQGMYLPVQTVEVDVVEVLMLLFLVPFVECTADQGRVLRPLLPGLLLPVQQPLLFEYIISIYAYTYIYKRVCTFEFSSSVSCVRNCYVSANVQPPCYGSNSS
jgi:hypothetical protein